MLQSSSPSTNASATVSALLDHLSQVRTKYQRLNAGETEHSFLVLYEQVNFAEFIVKYLTTLLAAALNGRRPYSRNEETARLVGRIGKTSNFGDWLQALASVAGEAIGEAGLDVQARAAQTLQRRFSDLRVASLRNTFVGHGIYDPTGSSYRNAIESLRRCRLLDDAYEACRDLSRTLPSVALELPSALAPFVLVEPNDGRVEILDSLDLFLDPPEVEYADHRAASVRAVTEGVFEPIDLIHSHASGDEPQGWALEREVEEMRRDRMSAAVRLEPVLAEIARWLEGDARPILHLTAPAGTGKSTLTLSLDGLDFVSDRPVIYVPLNRDHCRSEWVLPSYLALRLGFGWCDDWESVCQKLERFFTAPGRAPAALVVFDGTDEVGSDDLAFFKHLSQTPAFTAGGIRWLFAGRPAERAKNQIYDYVESNAGLVNRVAIDASQAWYRQCLRRLVEQRAPAEAIPHLLDQIERSPDATFLTAKSWIELARLGAPFGDAPSAPDAIRRLVRNATEDSRKSESRLVAMLHLLAEMEVSLPVDAIAALLHDDAPAAASRAVRSTLRRHDLFFERSTGMYRLSHAEYRRVLREDSAVHAQVLREVIDRVVDRHLCSSEGDFRLPGPLHDFWIHGFSALLPWFSMEQVERVLIPVNHRQSFLWKREEWIRNLPATVRGEAYRQQLDDLVRIRDRIAAAESPLRPTLVARLLTHFVLLFNCHNRDIQWRAEQQLIATIEHSGGGYDDLVSAYLELFSRFESLFGTLERHPGRDDSILSTILSSLDDLRLKRCEIWEERGYTSRFLAQLKNVIRSSTPKLYKRPLEFLLKINRDMAENRALLLEIRVARHAEDRYLANWIDGQLGALGRQHIDDVFDSDWKVRRDVLLAACDDPQLAHDVFEKIRRNSVGARLLVDSDREVRKALYRLIHSQPAIALGAGDKIQLVFRRRLARRSWIGDDRRERTEIEDLLALLSRSK